MQTPILVICENNFAIRYLANLYFIHHEREIKGFKRFKKTIILEDGSPIHFIRNIQTKSFLKKDPRSVIVSENAFIESYL